MNARREKTEDPVERALYNAGYPGGPGKIRGRQCRFRCTHGSDEVDVTLCITSVGLLNRSELYICVERALLFNADLKYLKYDSEKRTWIARAEMTPYWFEGELTVMP